MDGVSDDFSGLPEYKSRRERRSERLDQRLAKHRTNPHRGHRTRVLIGLGFMLSLLLVVVALVAFLAPTPYLGTSHQALANSIGSAGNGGCRPAGSSWICRTGTAGSAARYQVKVDWAGCWTGRLVNSRVASGSNPAISGCVSLIDHLRAG